MIFSAEAGSCSRALMTARSSAISTKPFGAIPFSSSSSSALTATRSVAMENASARMLSDRISARACRISLLSNGSPSLKRAQLTSLRSVASHLLLPRLHGANPNRICRPRALRAVPSEFAVSPSSTTADTSRPNRDTSQALSLAILNINPIEAPVVFDSESVIRKWKTSLVERDLFNKVAIEIGKKRKWRSNERDQIANAHHLFSARHDYRLQVRDLDQAGNVLGYDPTIEDRVEAEVQRRVDAFVRKLRAIDERRRRA